MLPEEDKQKVAQQAEKPALDLLFSGRAQGLLIGMKEGYLTDGVGELHGLLWTIEKATHKLQKNKDTFEAIFDGTQNKPKARDMELFLKSFSGIAASATVVGLSVQGQNLLAPAQRRGIKPIGQHATRILAEAGGTQTVRTSGRGEGL